MKSITKITLQTTALVCIALLLWTCGSSTSKPETTQSETALAPPTAPAPAAEAAPADTVPDTLLNTANYLIIGNYKAEVKVVPDGEHKRYPDFEILAGYDTDVILGKGITYDDVKLYRKYNPQTTFADYPVAVYDGPLAEPDFSTDPDAKRFITRIKNGCAEGVNFAGHFTLITWGCGSPCQSGVVVDRKNGHIWGGYGSSSGADFRADSKLIVLNSGAIDRETNLIRVCSYCVVRHEIWNETEFVAAPQP